MSHSPGVAMCSDKYSWIIDNTMLVLLVEEVALDKVFDKRLGVNGVIVVDEGLGLLGS